MAKPATGELRRLADGWEARVRIEGKHRRGFFLKFLRGEVEARERCTAMATIAVRLRGAGESREDIERILERLAETKPGRPWDAALASIEVLAAGNAAKGATLVPSFADFAKDWTS